MKYTDYYERVEFNPETKKYELQATYGIGTTAKTFEGVVNRATDTASMFRKFREEFKALLNPPKEA